jgi:hypothetical protein
VIPIIFVSYLYYRSVATNLEQNIKNSILLESSYKSKEISQYIQVRQKSLNQLGKLKIFSVAVEYQRFEGINNFFNSLLKSDTEYKGLLFVDRNKTLKAYNFYDNDGKYINNATTYWNSILQKIVYITDDTGIVKINENNSCIVVVAKVKDEFDETKGYLISIYNNQPIKDYLIDAVNKFKKTQNYDLNYITGFVLNNKCLPATLNLFQT